MQSSYSIIKYTEINGREVITHPPVVNHIKRNDTHLQIEDGYIDKASSIIEEAKLEAEKIIKNSESKAKNILQNAEEEAGRIKETSRNEGYQEGYRNGYQEGYQHGMDEANRAAEEVRKSADDYMKSSKLAVDEYIKSSHDEIIKLALNISKQIINSEISINPDIISKIAEKVLSRAVDKTQLILKVNPEDFDTVKERKELLSKYVDNSNNLFIVADYSVSKGAIKAETPSGFIDGSIDTQLEMILKNMLEE